MNVVVGTLLLLAAGILYGRYQPKSKDGKGLCGLCALMGLMGTIVSGGPVVLQIVQYVMQAGVLVCCVVQLHREKVFSTRRRAKLTPDGSEKEVPFQVCA